jgi:FAD/FMN-containing dehydrogenase
VADDPILSLLDELRCLLGPDGLVTDRDAAAWMTQDIWAAGAPPLAVAAPVDTDQLSACLRLAAGAGAGVPVLPRGGGLSYTGGYSGPADALLIDTRRMNRILRLDPVDMVVTVQAGCTWAALRDALTPLGLRTPFWGPLSGLSSTIGGGVSQNNAFFGAGTYGTTAESVVGLTVVTVDGTILSLGTGMVPGRPTYRHFGPDLAGLFCGDTGALAVKAEVTLRLIPAPAETGSVSFALPDGPSLLRGMSGLSRAGIGAEVFGFDPALTAVRLRRAGLAGDLRTLGNVLGGQGSWTKGLAAAAKVVTAGRSHLEEAGHNLHVIVDGRSRAAVQADLDAARRLVSGEGGREIENAVPTIVRSQPFTAPTSILGPAGERWVPVHGIVAHSRAPACLAEIEGIFADRAGEMAAHGVTRGCLTTTLSTNGLLIEPVFYWPEERLAVHEHLLDPAHLAKLPRHGANPAATALVADLRRAVVAVFRRHGAAHFQVGRCYPLADAIAPEALALLAAVKRHLDPHSRLNPGALGLP